MSFASLISKEIDKKRKKAAGAKSSKKQKAEQKPKDSDIPNEQDPILASISDEKLKNAINQLDPNDPNNDENLSKENQLHKLDLLMKAENKEARYTDYLNAEKEVDPSIDLQDIGAIGEKKRRLEMQIRKFLKFMLSYWQENPEAPPQQYTLAMLEEVKKDIIKLLYKLRSGKLSESMVISLSTIVYYIQHKEFVKANEAYMKLSIGNTAWPIGIRDVGIHARSALSKITGEDKSTVANIMQGEATRKWIIAVKRVISYTETMKDKT